jgi:tetratricopeptide (TPR) repeat protein
MRAQHRPSLVLASLLVLAGGAAGCAATSGSGDSGRRMVVAEVAVERGAYPVAAREYRLAAAAAHDPVVAEHAARLAFDHGQDRELERIAREWLARDGASEVARRFLAVALLQLDHREEAARQFAKLIASAYPTPAEAFLALDESLAELRNDTGAARVVGALAKSYPTLPEAAYAEGALALQAGDSPTAIAAAVRASAMRPGWRAARWLEARARTAGGDCEHGLEVAQELTAEAADADRLVYAWLLAACERPAEARPYFEDLARGTNARAEALEGLGALATDARRWDEATQRYSDLLALGRNTDRAFYGLATVADRKGEGEHAARLYARITSGTHAVAAQLRAYRLLLEAGEPAAAARGLDEFVAGAPESAVAATAGRAQILAETGRPAEALELLRRAEGVFPDREELRFARATILEDTGEVTAAVAQLRALLRERPLDPTARNALGFTLADHGEHLPEAESLIRAALADRPDSAAIRDSLGWVLYRRGATTEAVEWLKRAYAGDADPEVAAHLGEAEWAAGDTAAATAVWREALAHAPGDRHLRAAMERHLGPTP